VHPGIVLADRALFRERLPCFVVGDRVAVLPAFGSFTGLGLMSPEPGARVFVVADSEVVPVASHDS
jgi:metallophosphoesterase superfamily enzyme